MNRIHTRHLRRVGAAVAASLLLGSLAACGTNPDSTATDSAPELPAKVDSIAAMLPASIQSKGKLTVAVATYPPAAIQPADGGPLTGWDIENTRAIAAVLGLQVDFKSIPFDGVITGLAAGRYDGATGEIYITSEREASVTFISNHLSAMALLVPASGSKVSEVPNETDLCGLTVAAELGSAEAALISKAAKTCTAQGKPALNVKTFSQQAQVNLALSEGRIDAAASSASQVAYIASQTGTFKLVPLPWAPTQPTGLAIARNSDSAQFAKAVQAATQYLIDDGDLQKILDTFNDGQGAIKTAQIMPAS